MSELSKKLKTIAADISVLYAEDEQAIREQYANIFRLLFKEVKAVENGAIALEEYHKKSYDLLITDLTMPIMDGVNLISEILKINPLQHTIIMTAHNTNDNLRSSIDFQVDGILLKPVEMDKLFTLLYKIANLIYFKKNESVDINKEKKLQYILQNKDTALFLVVIDKFKEITKQFGNETIKSIEDTVQNHLSNFGIEEGNVVLLHDDVIMCGIRSLYLDRVLDSLQSFSNSSNTLIVFHNDIKIYITLSYGIVMLENHDILAHSTNLLNHINNIVADIKSDEQSTFVVKMDVDLEEAKKVDSLSWLGQTQEALEQDTLVPFYQAIIDIQTNEICSYEIFSRIKQGDKYILPELFIDLSKKAGILGKISKSVFKLGFKRLAKTDYNFHINLGETELNENAIEEYIIYLSSYYNIEKQRIVLDIEDFSTLSKDGKIVKSLLRLKDLGYKIAFKKFGSGNINLEMILILKPDYIKVNQILIQKSLEDKNMKNMLIAFLDYMKKSNVETILVGVESKEILETAKEFGFDYAQGYYISDPSSDLVTKLNTN